MFDFLKSIFCVGDSLERVINDRTFIVDVRTPTEFDSGSVRNAVNIPLDRIAMNIHKFKDKEHIVVFCRSGNRSSQAINILKQNGIYNVSNGRTKQNVEKYLK